MLPPAPNVLLCRQGFADAQPAMVGGHTPLGFFYVGWYGTDTDDERGSFAIVNTSGPLLSAVGNFLNVKYQRRSVNVYVIASKSNLTADIILTRRAYLAIALLAKDPVLAEVFLSQ